MLSDEGELLIRAFSQWTFSNLEGVCQGGDKGPTGALL